MELKIRIRTGGEEKIQLADYAFITYFSATALIALLSRILSIVGASFLARPTVLILIGVFLVLSFISVPSRRWKDCVTLYVGIAIVFLLSYLLTPELSEWYTNPNWGLAYRVFRIDRGIYAYLLIKIVEDPKRILKNLHISAIVWGLYLLLQTYQRVRLGYFITTENDGVTQAFSSDNLAYGYNCTFVALIFFARYRSSKSKGALVAGFVFSLLSVLYGSRGCLLVLGAYFIVVQYFKLREERSFKKIAFAVLLVVLIATAYFFFDAIILVVSNIVSHFGIQSTNIAKLLNNSISEANGRDRLWAAVGSQIKETFPLGKGAFGDRLAAGRVFAWGYSHNIFLEMTASFGIVGVIILIVLIIQSIRILVSKENGYYTELFAIFFCCCMKLIVSDSFWYSSFFWGAIAIGVCALKYIKYPDKIKGTADI